MIYTKEKLKAFKNSQLLEGRESFTGVVKDINDNVFYYLNGKLHRTDGPAIEWNNRKSWLNGERYGWGDNFTNESWIRFVTLNLLK